MSLWLLIIRLVVPLFVLLAGGVYIAVSLAATGILGLEFLVKVPQLTGNLMFKNLNSYTLLAIPLYIFMGEIMLHSGLSHGLFSGASKLTKVIPGSLLHTNILSCAFFAAVSGSSLATAGTIGKIAYSEEKERGYSRSMIGSTIAAGGCLGILIPPSIDMIIYCVIVRASVGRLFAAGLIPGILLALLFSLYVGFRTKQNPNIAEKTQKISWKYFAGIPAALKELWPLFFIMGIVFGGIYGGIFTPTEAAAVASVAALGIAALNRKLSFTLLRNSALAALETTAMILFIMLGAQIFAISLSMLKVPAHLCALVADLPIHPMIIWFFGIIPLYLVLGCFLDCVSMIVLTVPIIYPIVVGSFGFDPIMFGVVLVILIECSLLTPPVGMNIFVVHNVTGGRNIMALFKAALPFVICLLLMITVLTYFPQIALFLPSLLFD
ncbi:TRAP transporter, DctM subunit [Desulfocicer vacuolatum DSM 3385]|uniref:TRAP transporter, DctM subunit n=1 Tax=Desulfocicer vacuolatum DSM 3385 TaxID=1121400 RepID=A0A1W1YSA6_9BACT|nr:TRAP transporter large permease [Desulfocicer vacuolatum]SMC39029.1 TRAP transporter, DctM subunit [Desulfocicer vacuolatum DSM 3385]